MFKKCLYYQKNGKNKKLQNHEIPLTLMTKVVSRTYEIDALLSNQGHF